MSVFIKSSFIYTHTITITSITINNSKQTNTEHGTRTPAERHESAQIFISISVGKIAGFWNSLWMTAYRPHPTQSQNVCNSFSSPRTKMQHNSSHFCGKSFIWISAAINSWKYSILQLPNVNSLVCNVKTFSLNADSFNGDENPAQCENGWMVWGGCVCVRE